jgi:hypothetical protein
VALLGDQYDNATIANFDPQTDTVWNKPQILSQSAKAQVRSNIDVPSISDLNERERIVDIVAPVN